MLWKGLHKDKYCLTSTLRDSMFEHDDPNILDKEDAGGHML